jgi:hypothetical protein
VSNRTYDEYLHVLPPGTPVEAEFTLEEVEPLKTGSRICGFLKRSHCDEISELHRAGVICYDPEQQRGWRITYRDGVEHRRQYVIKPSKVKEIGSQSRIAPIARKATSGSPNGSREASINRSLLNTPASHPRRTTSS